MINVCGQQTYSEDADPCGLRFFLTVPTTLPSPSASEIHQTPRRPLLLCSKSTSRHASSVTVYPAFNHIFSGCTGNMINVCGQQTYSEDADPCGLCFFLTVPTTLPSPLGLHQDPRRPLLLCDNQAYRVNSVTPATSISTSPLKFPAPASCLKTSVSLHQYLPFSGESC